MSIGGWRYGLVCSVDILAVVKAGGFELHLAWLSIQDEPVAAHLSHISLLYACFVFRISTVLYAVRQQYKMGLSAWRSVF